MRTPPIYTFGPYLLDAGDAALRRGAQAVPLTPKAFAVLQYLVARAGRLVTKDELIDSVWSGVFVGDAVLKVCVREIRRALHDDPKTPRFIETVHRRGYRFIAAVSQEDTSVPAAAVAHVKPTAGDAGSPSVGSVPIDVPETHYARSDDVNIAYQVIGEGSIDLVFVMGWVSHLDYFWAEPSFARFLRRLASFSRLILFDKRGTGLSDRVAELPTLEQRMDDVRAVLDAVGSREAALLGVSEGGPMCSLFAATYPEKTLALIMIGSYAKRIWDPAYPWAPTTEQRERFNEEIRTHWGGPVGLEDRAPSVAADPRFRAWWSTYLRMGASPGAALALTRMNAEIDIRHVLPTIRVPTLILHRQADRCLKVEEGRYLADRIPGARLVELPGEDHLPFVGDQDAVLDEIEEFLTGFRRGLETDRVLATVLSARIGREGVASPVAPWSARVDPYQAHVEWELSRFRGGRLDWADEGFLAVFDGPARAIRCACALSAAARRFGVVTRVGLHTGECEISADRLGGLTIDISRLIAAHARTAEVLVSGTVKDLVAGSGLRFEPRGALPIRETGHQWPLFAVGRT